MQQIKIGVFDSGIGGLSFVRAFNKAMPEYEVIFKNDSQHLPYGTRELNEIYSFTKPILQSLIDEGCAVIVVACNTVSTNFITKLRMELSVPLVAVEPMIKPAAEASKNGVICVCATPRTLQSERYTYLKKHYALGIKIIEPDCSDWTMMIETNNLDRAKIAKIIDDACATGADQIVLGCTHYHWIESQIKELARGRAAVIQPERPVIEQLKRVLAKL